MKRVIPIILTLVLILTTVPALADLNELIEGHNRGCNATGATPISGEPEIMDGLYRYHINEKINVIFSMEGDTLKSFSCVCLDDSEIGEFLAQCVTSFYNLGGLMAYTYCHDAVLTDFLSARAGYTPGSNSSVDGLLFQIVKESYGYTFIVVKVKKS